MKETGRPHLKPVLSANVREEPLMLVQAKSAILARTVLAAALLIGMLTVSGSSQEPGAKPPVQVTIKDDKAVAAVEPSLPMDPVRHMVVNNQGNMMVNMRVDNQTLHLGFIQTLFHIDGRVMFPGNPPGRITAQNQPLPKTRDGKPRMGSMAVYEIGKLSITQEVEVVATKSKPGQKRRLDAAMVRYFVDNKDNQPHKVGMRIFMDVFIVNNDGALFAAPNQPGKILDGVELKGKMIPDYLQFLQRPDLQNPGFVAHMTYNFGKSFEMPDRIILTSLGAQMDQWNLGVMQAGGDSAMGVYWDPKEIKAGSKVKMAYSYGQGIAPNPEGDGMVSLVLGGSFEPGKLFTVAAQVQDPAPGQTLALELPPGMERIEGKERQPVPALDDTGNSMVLWKARVLNTGQFTLRVHSSTGVTQTKIITITRPSSLE
jgi:hypothetical protein